MVDRHDPACGTGTAIAKSPWLCTAKSPRLKPLLPDQSESGRRRRHRTNLNEWSRALLVTIHDGVSRHVGYRLHCERWIEPADRRVDRTTSDEEIGNVPALAETVYHRRFWITAHAGTSLMVPTRPTISLVRAPHVRRTHRAPNLLGFAQHIFHPRPFVRPPPVVG